MLFISIITAGILGAALAHILINEENHLKMS